VQGLNYQLQDYTTQVLRLVHDLQNVDFSQQEITDYINEARLRASLDLHCVRNFYTGLNIIPSQEQYPITGGVGGCVMTNVGSGYPLSAVGPAPSVTFSAPAYGGVTATGTAILDATLGCVDSIQMTNWGTGYTAAPTVTIAAPSSGTTATATATCLQNVLDILSISLLWPGNTNRYTLGWLPFSPFQAYCRAQPTTLRNPSVWTNYDVINTFFLYPIPDQAYIIEIDAVQSPPTQTLVNLTDVDINVLPPNADCIQFYAAHLALMKLQNFEHADYLLKKYQARSQEIKLTRQDRRYYNVYKSWWRRLNRM